MSEHREERASAGGAASPTVLSTRAWMVPVARERARSSVSHPRSTTNVNREHDWDGGAEGAGWHQNAGHVRRCPTLCRKRESKRKRANRKNKPRGVVEGSFARPVSLPQPSSQLCDVCQGSAFTQGRFPGRRHILRVFISLLPPFYVLDPSGFSSSSRPALQTQPYYQENPEVATI